MGNYNEMTTSYQNDLQKQQEVYKAKIQQMIKENALDDANLEKIKLNVVGIFSQMFDKCTNANEKTQNIEQLKRDYIHFLNHIPQAWFERKAKAQAFNDDQTVIIESIKIEIVEQIKQSFTAKVD